MTDMSHTDEFNHPGGQLKRKLDARLAEERRERCSASYANGITLAALHRESARPGCEGLLLREMWAEVWSKETLRTGWKLEATRCPVFDDSSKWHIKYVHAATGTEVAFEDRHAIGERFSLSWAEAHANDPGVCGTPTHFIAYPYMV